MSDYISREAAIAYIREQSEEMSKAFEELGGESGIYADAYNDLAEDFHRIPAADVAPVVHGRWEGYTHSRYCGIDEYGEPIYRDGIVYYCSNPKCRRKTVIKENYCPACGAKMDMKGVRTMSEYVTFAQLADALRRCGRTPTSLDSCKGCAYNDGTVWCVAKMTSRAAAIIDMLATDPPAVPRDQWADLAELE